MKLALENNMTEINTPDNPTVDCSNIELPNLEEIFKG